MPYIRSLDKNTIKGNVHVSIFGATTPNTEWEFLTANSMAFVPYRTVPYQQYITRKSYSLATLLKEHGYSTYAMHSYYPQGYNRNIVYPLIGFDEFLHLNNMENVTYIREYPDDKSTYDNLISIFENKKEDEKIFNFTLTMQNHGSYTDESYTPTIIAENNEYPKLNQYLSLIKETDNSFKYLLEYFENYNEPVVILMFGDHQPYVEDEFYEKLLSTYEDPESKEAKEMKYITPYIIWANYDFDYESYNIPDVSINYLSSILLDVAGIEKNLYLKFLDNLQEYIPIITGNGYVDIENHYHDFTDETKYSNLIKQYNYLQYNNMFDKNHKLVEMFSVSKELN
jgi:phosphoglycerol transferase MdoB-like AlkP superfamily enzyme